MESVIIAAPHVVDVIERLGSEIRSSRNRDESVVVESGTNRIYVSRAPGVESEYEPEDLALITVIVATPHFYTVDFSDLALCKRVLLAIADDAGFVVDNDHGVILPGDRFAERIRSVPDWDWRKT